MPDALLFSSMIEKGISWLVVGRLVSVKDGRLYVDYPGNPTGAPVAARTILARPLPKDTLPLAAVAVLLAFTENSLASPIVVGFVTDTLPAAEADAPKPPSRQPDAASIPRRLSLKAMEAVEIVCGESVIELKSDGTVMIRGRRIASRARDANTIKGASVRIN